MSAKQTKSQYELKKVDDVLDIVASQAQALEACTMALHEARGAVLAQDVTAAGPLPPFPASIKVRDVPAMHFQYFAQLAASDAGRDHDHSPPDLGLC